MERRDISTKIPGIYKRLNPDSTVYLLRLKRAGKAYNETYDCFDAAVARKQEILQEIKLAEVKKHMPAMRTVREAVAEYRKTPRTGNAMHNTNVAYRMDWWAEYFGEKAIGDITSADIQMGINQKLQDKKTANTAIKYLNAISLLFDAAKSWGWVQSNPAKEVLKPRIEKKRRRTLSRPEQARLLKACLKSKNKLLYPLVLLALKTGCRQNELMTLRWQNVDLKNGVIIIEDVDTKAKHARTLPINSGICHFLVMLARSSSGVFVLGGGAFTNRFQTAWEFALERAKLEDFCFHGLRHTRITEWVQQGIPLQEVQKLSGHRTIQMLMHYSHLGPQAAIEAARRVR